MNRHLTFHRVLGVLCVCMAAFILVGCGAPRTAEEYHRRAALAQAWGNAMQQQADIAGRRAADLRAQQSNAVRCDRFGDQITCRQLSY